MQKISKKIFLITAAMFLFSGFFMLFFGGGVNADNVSLYVSPAGAAKDVGSAFDISAIAGTSGDKVCVVGGTLVFNNLTCKSITLASDIIAQSSPTCSDPYFLLGIPKCAAADKNLFTVSVEGERAGSASVSFVEAEIIGNGVLISSDSTGGNYTIEEPVHGHETQQTNEQNQSNQNQVNSSESNNNQNIINQPAGIANAGVTSAAGNWLISNIIWIITVILIILILVYIIPKLMKKNKKTKEK